jgi:ferritin-like metal-binding protein YciE
MFGKVKSLRELFEIELRYAYDCEQKLVEKGLPSMIESATSPELKNALQKHLMETRNQLARLERVFSAIGTERDTNSNAILDDMTKAAKDSVSHIEDPALRDAALIVNGNFVEHYEIALYGSLLSFARQLGIQQATSLLEETLREEKAADLKLTELANSINSRAARSASA